MTDWGSSEMAIRAEVSSDGREMIISVEGRFDFSAHRDFRGTYEKICKGLKSYTVDMRDASYLDSSALGMLLLLRDHAGGDAAEVRIVNCNPDVRRILNVSNFEQLFEIG
jgi:HptB-dependent secretion and biofilm anti anti-sigma factor